MFIQGKSCFKIGRTKMGRRMVLENLLGPTVLPMKGRLLKIKFKGKGNLFGPMEKYMKVIGSIIKWREEGYSHGQMEEDMRDNF